MSEINKRRWRILGRVAVIATLGSTAFGLAVAPGEIMSAVRGAVTGLLMTALLGSYSILTAAAGRKSLLGRLSFLPALALQSAVYLVLILLGLELGALVPTGGPRGLQFDSSLVWSMLFSFFCVFAFNFVLQVNRILGQGELFKFVIGRYHRPRPEERFFLFLDLVSSTALAERLGGVRFFALINQVYADIAEPILEQGGEIHKYVGDEVIVTWTAASGAAAGRCLDCALAIAATLEGLGSAYQAEFGVQPAFRYGLHFGTVMSGELGNVKKEIAYVGDPVNTAARLIDVCRDTGHRYIASDAALDRVGPRAGIAALPLGPIRLRGKEATLPLFALSRVAGAAA